MDKAIEKAVSIARNRRYPALSEFLHDLAHPNSKLMPGNFESLMERHPLLVCKALILLLLLSNIYLLYLLAS